MNNVAIHDNHPYSPSFVPDEEYIKKEKEILERKQSECEACGEHEDDIKFIRGHKICRWCLESEDNTLDELIRMIEKG